MVGETLEPLVLPRLRGRGTGEIPTGAKLVAFWASWCEPCRTELTEIADLARQRPDLQVVTISIDRREDRRAARTALRELDVPGPAFIDNGAAANTCGVSGIPTTFAVDAQGVVRDFVTGYEGPQRLRELASITTDGSAQNPD